MKAILQKLITQSIILIFLTDCEIKKNKKQCWDVNLCIDDVRTAVKRTKNSLPGDGIVYLEDRIFYLSYFEKQSRKIIDRYVKVNCRCDVIYFGDSLPIISNKIEFPDFYKN